MRFIPIILMFGILFTWSVPAVASPVDGTWGVVRDGLTVCSGTTVIVLRDGKYFRVLPNTGYSKGRYNAILSRSTYKLKGDRLTVAAAFALSNPDPKQVFLFERKDGGRLIREDRKDVVFARCPEEVEPQEFPN